MRRRAFRFALAMNAALWLGHVAAAEARFLQTDPVGYKDDLNLYQYAFNDPLNMSDPTGREVWIRGDAEFRRRVRDDIRRGESGPKGREYWGELRESEHRVTIVRGERNQTVFDSPESAQNGVGSGSTIYYNPDQTRGNRDETGSAERESYIGLVHEGPGHALAAVRGEDPVNRYDAEVDAISRENDIRAEQGLPLAVPPAPPSPSPDELERRR